MTTWEDERKQRRAGQKARKWRREVAALSTESSPSSIFTLKFPLDASSLPTECFEDANKLGNIVLGTDIAFDGEGFEPGKGTLIGFLCLVHLSGFKVERKKVSRVTLPLGKFRTSLESKYPKESIPDILTPEKIREQVDKQLRRKSDLFTKEFLKSEFKKRLSDSGKKSNDENSPIVEVITEAISESIYENCKSFQEYNKEEKKPILLKAIRKKLHEEGVDFPECPQSEQHEDIPERLKKYLDSATIKYCSKRAARVDKTTIDKEHAIHQVVALVARELCQKDVTSSNIKKRITTGGKHEGLSWLFNYGLKIFQELSPDKLMKHLPSDGNIDKELVTWLCKYAKTIPPELPLFRQAGYHDFRSQVGGKLDSWIVNYWTRLTELKSAFENGNIESQDDFLPAALNEACVQEKVLRHLRLSPDRVREQIAQARQELQKGGQLIDKFMGVSEDDANLPTAQDISDLDAIAIGIEFVRGMLNQVISQCKQRLDDIATPSSEGKVWEEMKGIRIPDWLEKPSRLNRISGGNLEPEAELQGLASRFSLVMDKWLEHGKRLVNKYPQEKECEVENFLHRLSKLAQRMHATNKEEIIKLLAPHFEDYNEKTGRSKNCNKLIHNSLGAIWRSPHSRSRHQPYALKDTIDKQKWVNDLTDIAEQWRKDIRSDYKTKLSDWLGLQNLIFSYQLEPLRQEQQVDAQSAMYDDCIADKVPSYWAVQLEGDSDSVPGSLCLQVFNLYYSELRGFLPKLLRESFILRVALQPILRDKPSFIQRPKETQWTVPERIRRGKEISQALDKLEEAELYQNGRVNDIPKAHEHIVNSELDEENKRAYLSHAPHEWHLCLPWLKSKDTSSKQLCLYKGGRIKRARSFSLLLRGPSSYKNKIVQVMLKKWKAQEHALILEQQYKMSLCWEADGPKVAIDSQGVSAFGAVPFEPTVSKQKFEIWHNIVAIDLGERGIGYAVFSLKDFLKEWGSKTDAEILGSRNKTNPIKSGSIFVPAIRGLINAAKRHRKVAQPRQRMQQSYSSVLAEHRATTIGQVCNEIDNLCAIHHAFPILEHQVGGFESGAKQLLLVYDSVLRIYRYSDVDAHKKIRKHHWMGAGQWKHPYIQERKRKKENQKNANSNEYSDKSQIEPFNLFPGATVNASRTSQICSACGRNPLVALERTLKKSQGKATVDKYGCTELDDGRVHLFKRESPQSKSKASNYRRLKQRTPWWQHNAEAKGYTREELRKIIKANMRRPPRSTRSKDTSQSRYFCVYEDCDNHWDKNRLEALLETSNLQQTWGTHADENAAINIGRRFLFDDIRAEQKKPSKLHRAESYKKLLEYEKK